MSTFSEVKKENNLKKGKKCFCVFDDLHRVLSRGFLLLGPF
jgi:hypothetical protein